MSENTLPVEVLYEIFRRLDGWSVMASRLVCRQWREAVDTLPDKYWKEICGREYRKFEYILVRNKHGLTWAQTYRAVNSWSWWKIRRAKVKIIELTLRVNRFKVLPNGILACFLNNRHTQSKTRLCNDTIIFYDMDTMNDCGILEFDFPFRTDYFYDHDEFVIVFMPDGRLCLVLKQSKEQFYFGRRCPHSTVDDYEAHILTTLYIIPPVQYKVLVVDRNVYFKTNLDSFIYVTRLIYNNGVPSINVEQIGELPFDENVVEFSFKDNKLHILTDEANIYTYYEGKLDLVTEINIDADDAFVQLSHFNFDWRDEDLFNWIKNSNTCMFFPNELCDMRHLCGHSNLLIAENLYRIKIYYTASIPQGLQDLANLLTTGPIKSIDVSCVMRNNFEYYSGMGVSKLDIVETGTNHRIVFTTNRLFTMTLSNKPKRKCKYPSFAIKKPRMPKKLSQPKTKKHDHKYRSARKFEKRSSWQSCTDEEKKEEIS